jgi:hypothetical protein
MEKIVTLFMRMIRLVMALLMYLCVYLILYGICRFFFSLYLGMDTMSDPWMCVYPSAIVAFIFRKNYMDLSSKILNRVRGVDHGKSMKNDVVNMGNEKKGNKFMDKFFFGYLSLKWRRLVRTILILSHSTYIFAVLIHFIGYVTQTKDDKYYLFQSSPSVELMMFSSFLLLSIALIILISYLVEPFVRKQH